MPKWREGLTAIDLDKNNNPYPTFANERNIMQLIYLYIDGYCSFHETEFNFSQDLKLHYNTETFTFEISDTHSRLPEQFWGKNISNLSVVVGNNGAGKTSLMQYIIDIFLEAHGGRSASGQGILLFTERNMLYGYFSHSWQKQQIGIALESRQYKFVQLLNLPEVRSILGKTKMIYLSNALSMRDSLRGQWYNGNRLLYIDLLMENQLQTVLNDIDDDISQVSYSIDRNTFQDIYPDAEYEDDPYIFLKFYKILIKWGSVCLALESHYQVCYIKDRKRESHRSGSTPQTTKLKPLMR